jgi:hypothetical protein
MASTSVQGTTQQDIYGLGEVTVEGPGETTNSAVQEIWSAQMAVISEVINNINSGIYNPEDLDRLVEALQVLEDLAENGLVVNGTTYYITNNMADALNDVLASFAAVGITPDMNTSTMSDAQKTAALQGISNTTPEGQAVQSAVNAAAKVVHQDLSTKFYAAAMFKDMIYAAGAEFDSLAAYLKFVEETLELLNDLLEVSTDVTVSDPWVADLTLDNSGCIPPDAVDDIQDFIDSEAEDESDFQFDSDDVTDSDTPYTDFSEIYWSEYEQAEELAEQNGTTVEEEMANFHGASDMLKEFMAEYTEYFTSITNILDDYLTVEIVPEVDMTSEEIAATSTKIWDTYEGLNKLIKELEAMPDADQDLIDSLTKITTDIENAWNQALTENGVKEGTTPESLKEGSFDEDDIEDITEDFVENYILSLQPGEPARTNLDNGIVEFQNKNEKLQKDFQLQMTEMNSYFKVASSMEKSQHDMYMAIANNM